MGDFLCVRRDRRAGARVLAAEKLEVPRRCSRDAVCSCAFVMLTGRAGELFDYRVAPDAQKLRAGTKQWSMRESALVLGLGFHHPLPFERHSPSQRTRDYEAVGSCGSAA